MRSTECRQGSKQWIQARAGLPTASRFDSIMTPKKRELASARHKYKFQLAAEWLLGVTLDDELELPWLTRGKAMQAEAVNWYELVKDVAVTEIGFALSDCGRYGASPDYLVGDDGLTEIKCPAAAQHVAHLLMDPNEHAVQVQGQLLVTGRQWCDVLSYCPGLPAACVRYTRDEEMIGQLAGCLDTFCGELAAAKTRLIEMGCVPKVQRTAEAA